MAERAPKSGKPSAAEKAAIFYRNFNVVGAVALFGVGVLAPPVAPVANVLAGINVLQAGGGEIVRRAAKKRRKKQK
jgi:hypothetical protein